MPDSPSRIPPVRPATTATPQQAAVPADEALRRPASPHELHDVPAARSARLSPERLAARSALPQPGAGHAPTEGEMDWILRAGAAAFDSHATDRITEDEWHAVLQAGEAAFGAPAPAAGSSSDEIQPAPLRTRKARTQDTGEEDSAGPAKRQRGATGQGKVDLPQMPDSPTIIERHMHDHRRFEIPGFPTVKASIAAALETAERQQELTEMGIPFRSANGSLLTMTPVLKMGAAKAMHSLGLSTEKERASSTLRLPPLDEALILASSVSNEIKKLPAVEPRTGTPSGRRLGDESLSPAVNGAVTRLAKAIAAEVGKDITAAGNEGGHTSDAQWNKLLDARGPVMGAASKVRELLDAHGALPVAMFARLAPFESSGDVAVRSRRSSSLAAFGLKPESAQLFVDAAHEDQLRGDGINTSLAAAVDQLCRSLKDDERLAAKARTRSNMLNQLKSLLTTRLLATGSPAASAPGADGSVRAWLLTQPPSWAPPATQSGAGPSQ
jgi:hypothetical protein